MTRAYDADREAFESGTRVVSALLGMTALTLLLTSPALAASINRSYTPTSELAGLAAASLVAAVVSTLVPGIWRLVGIALATAPLLAVVAAWAHTA